MPAKPNVPPQNPYLYNKPSARCGMCNGRIWKTIWEKGERSQVMQSHCTGRILTYPSSYRREGKRREVLTARRFEKKERLAALRMRTA